MGYHVDPWAMGVIYTVLSGLKIFVVAPPTMQNLETMLVRTATRPLPTAHYLRRTTYQPPTTYDLPLTTRPCTYSEQCRRAHPSPNRHLDSPKMPQRTMCSGQKVSRARRCCSSSLGTPWPCRPGGSMQSTHLRTPSYSGGTYR